MLHLSVFHKCNICGEYSVRLIDIMGLTKIGAGFWHTLTFCAGFYNLNIIKWSLKIHHFSHCCSMCSAFFFRCIFLHYSRLVREINVYWSNLQNTVLILIVVYTHLLLPNLLLMIIFKMSINIVIQRFYKY